MRAMAESPFKPHFFEREDESPDTAFYSGRACSCTSTTTRSRPRAALYGELLAGGRRDPRPDVELRSHMPPELRWTRLCGLGMNEMELRENDQLTDYVVHDLNADPALPFGDGEFDGAVVTVSVQYMTQPLEIFREVARVLKPGAPFIVTYSNRMFPTKAVRIWRALDDRERGGADRRLLPARRRLRRGERSQDRSIDSGGYNDPLFAVWAQNDSKLAIASCDGSTSAVMPCGAPHAGIARGERMIGSSVSKDEQAAQDLRLGRRRRQPAHGVLRPQARPLPGDHRSTARRPHARRAGGRARRSTRATSARGRARRSRASCSSTTPRRSASRWRRSWRRCCSTTTTSSTRPGLVTSFAVESRLADRVEACFTTGEGIPFADYGQEMVETIHAFSKAAYELFLPSVLLPALPELTERLTRGRHDPRAGLRRRRRARVAGTDVPAVHGHRASIRTRRRSRWRAQRIEDAGLGEHVHAEEMRGEDLTSEDAFDFIYAQISLHEMDDARVVLANARRALKDDGTLLITEIRGAGAHRGLPRHIQRRALAHRPVLRDPAGASRRAATPSASSRAPRSRRWRRSAGLTQRARTAPGAAALRRLRRATQVAARARMLRAPAA